MREVVSSNCTPPTAPSSETVAWPAVDVDDMAGDIGAPHPASQQLANCDWEESYCTSLEKDPL